MNTYTKTVNRLKITYTNATENYCIGEEFLDLEKSNIQCLKDLYNEGRKTWGRVVSKVFIDGPDKKPLHVGYVFKKREKYDDSSETFLSETWVSIEHFKETKTIEFLNIK
jgi:hypothetical protein